MSNRLVSHTWSWSLDYCLVVPNDNKERGFGACFP